MPIDTIYLTRHGHRLNWSLDLKTGVYHLQYPSPTGISVDPTLTLPGVRQSHELGAHISSLQFEPKPCRVYCSAFYRCLQTIQPTVEALKDLQKRDGGDPAADLDVRIETGLGEWFGSARTFTHPGPASPETLYPLFPTILAPPTSPTAYKPRIRPSPAGETIAELHDRVATALDMILADVDAEIAAYERDYPDDGNESQSHSQSGKRSRAILICSHAAPLIAMGRVLTGDMPEDPTVEDFRVFTAGLSTFVRRRAATDGVPNSTDAGVGNDRGIVAGRKVPDWRRGKGVRGGWDCVANGECGFLSGGAERGWHFSGEEDFNSMPTPPGAATPESEVKEGIEAVDSTAKL